MLFEPPSKDLRTGCGADGEEKPVNGSSSGAGREERPKVYHKYDACAYPGRNTREERVPG